jgi:hypothetical protein
MPSLQMVEGQSEDSMLVLLTPIFLFLLLQWIFFFPNCATKTPKEKKTRKK